MIYPDGSGSQDTIYPEVTAELRSGAIDTWNTRPNKGLYVHNKVILIDGTYQGVGNQKLVYATSQNLTLTSLRESNEVMLRIPNLPAYGDYSGNFEQIKSQSSADHPECCHATKTDRWCRQRQREAQQKGAKRQ